MATSHNAWARVGAVGAAMLLSALAALGTGGCSDDPPSGCTTASDCGSGMICTAGSCVPRGTDAGARDASLVDAGADTDASTPVVPTTSATFTPTTATFPSPERGFYGWSGDDFVTAYDAGSVAAAYAAGMRLVLASANLSAFRTSDLTAAWLGDLSHSFGEIRAAGMKVTLLLAYNFDAGGLDATATQIRTHLEQLRPVLAENEDVIAYMRAGFIGAWGEWHSSVSGNSCGYHSGTTPCDVADANRLIVRDALLANVPASIQIGFRYPPDLQRWYPDPREQHRVGLHNDCFLSGPSDTGTYQNDAQRDYVAALTEDNAFGGETCAGETPLRTSCADIMSEGARFHLAWLNDNYAPDFLDRWHADGCYDQVSSLIGYRIQLDALSHPERATRGSTIAVAVDLRNVGWARMFGQARPLVVTLRPRSTGASITAAGATALRTLASQATASSRIEVTVSIPSDAAPGDYDVLLGAPDANPSLADDARFAVRFANADDAAANQAWDDATSRFRAGTTLTIE